MIDVIEGLLHLGLVVLFLARMFGHHWPFL